MAEDPHGHPEPRFYTREFKLEAVYLCETSEKTVAQLARDLGVPERVLYRWRHELREQSEQAFPGKGYQSELEEENRRLKRELELLKQEREIVKKQPLSSRAASHDVCLHRQPSHRVRGQCAVPRAQRVGEWLLRLAAADSECS